MYIPVYLYIKVYIYNRLFDCNILFPSTLTVNIYYYHIEQRFATIHIYVSRYYSSTQTCFRIDAADAEGK